MFNSKGSIITNNSRLIDKKINWKAPRLHILKCKQDSCINIGLSHSDLN